MKNSIALLSLGLLMVGSVACSSTPKEQEVAPVQEPVVEQQAAISEPPVQPIVDTQSNTTSKPDLSLGAGSSGRGH